MADGRNVCCCCETIGAFYLPWTFNGRDIVLVDPVKNFFHL